jgi:peroxygenase
MADKSSKEVVAELPDYPQTVQRPVPKDLSKFIYAPEIHRANKAVSKEVPDGTSKYPDPDMENMTVARAHVHFWDKDKDGVIWPWDTYRGFREIGFGFILSFIAIFFIHGSFSYATAPSWIPDPFFRIWTKRMHKGKHGSDNGVYDSEGRFVPERFEATFTKYGSKVNTQQGLYKDDIKSIAWNNMCAFDPFGWSAERIEWWAFWYIAHDKDGFVSKEKVRAMYDGTLWYILAEETKNRRNRPGLFKNKYNKKVVKEGQDDFKLD